MRTINKTMNERRECGLCAGCGKVPSELFRCAECREKNNARSRSVRDRHAKNGRCFQCGKAKGESETLRCQECTGKAARAARRKRIAS